MKKLTPEQAQKLKELLLSQVYFLGNDDNVPVATHDHIVKFINKNTQGPILRQSYTPNSIYKLADGVDNIFDWEETPQGSDYWYQVQSNLLEVASLAAEQEHGGK